MLDYGLSSSQLAFVCALSSGVNIAAAAEQAAVSRDTVAQWRRTSLLFQQAFEHAQYDKALYFREKAENLFNLALQAIEQLLADPKTPPSVRLKAALAIITTATATATSAPLQKIAFQPPGDAMTDDQLPSAPPRAPASDAVNPVPVNPDAQPATASAPPAAASPRPSSLRHSPQTRKIAHPDVGRNSACPCGSGKKFKRCCLDKQVFKESVQRALSAV